MYVCCFFGSKERMRFIVALARLFKPYKLNPIPYLQSFQPLANSQ
jgi:hypothetical protein